MSETAAATSIESSPARKLKRVRPRWVVVALVLCVAAIFAWRFSNRGESRFVGRWSVHGPGSGAAHLELELTRFGTGTRRLTPAEPDAPIVEFAWRVEQERMIIYWPPSNGRLRERIELFVTNSWRRWQGEPELDTDVYVVEPTGANGYRLRSATSQGSGFVISRVEE